MHTARKLTLILGISILSASCGTIYRNPPKDPQRTSTLRSKTTRSGLANWAKYVVEAVNDKPVNYAASLTIESKEIVIPSGNQNIVLTGNFNQIFGGAGPFIARGDLNMNFKPGMDYQANGRVQGSKLLLWIEDTKTENPVSAVLQIPYQSMPRNYVTPIFIPVSN